MAPIKRYAKTFDPKSPSYRWKLWVVFKQTDHSVYFYWKRIFAVSACALLLGWFCLSAAAWSFVRYGRGFKEAHYVDLVLPWRWRGYRVSLANTYFARGRAALQRQNFSGAWSDLSSAVALAPANLRYRRTLADFEALAGQPRQAFVTLKPGLALAAAGHNEGYLREFYAIGYRLGAGEEVAEASGRVLPRTPDRTRIHRFIAFQIATTWFDRGRYDAAENVLDRWDLQSVPEGEALRARCESKQGLRDQAIRRLQLDLRRFQMHDDLWMALQLIQSEAGNWTQAHRYAVLRKLAHLENPSIRIDVIYSARRAGLAEEEKREIDAYCADFGTRLPALGYLEDLAVETGQPALAERARQLALKQTSAVPGFDLGPPSASLVARDYPGALQMLQAADHTRPPDQKGYEAVSAGIKAVSLLGEGEAKGKLAWSNFLGVATAVPPETRQFFETRLKAMGREKESEELASRLSGKPGPEPLQNLPPPKPPNPAAAAADLQAARSALAAGNYSRALAKAASAEGEAAPDNPPQKAALAGVRALSLLAIGSDSADLAWTNFTGAASALSPADRKFFLDRLHALKRNNEADDLASALDGKPAARSQPKTPAPSPKPVDRAAAAEDVRLAKSALQAGDYTQTLAKARAGEELAAPDDQQTKATLAGLKAVSLLAAGSDNADLAWASFTGAAMALSPPDRKFFLNRLKALGRPQQANELTSALAGTRPGDSRPKAPAPPQKFADPAAAAENLRLAKSALQSGDYAQTLAKVQAAEELAAPDDQQMKTMLAGLKAAALLAAGNDSATLAWENFTGMTDTLKSDDGTFLVGQLKRVGRQKEAQALAKRLRSL